MRLRMPAFEAVRVGLEGFVQGGLPIGVDGLRRAVVNDVWSFVADARVLMLVVVGPSVRFM